MYRPRIIPVLLLHNNGLYKTTQFNQHVYVGDPINAVKIFNDAEADELIFLDIDNNNFTDYKLIQKISEETMMPFSYGGNIRSVEVAKNVFDSGAEKVVLNTVLYSDYSLLNQIAGIYGNQSVVASIDVKIDNDRYLCFSHKGQQKQNVDIEQHVIKCVHNGAGEIMINSIDRDGTRAGYDIDLIRWITSLASVPVIACGGAGSLEDLQKAVVEGGASAAAAGSLFVFMGSRKSVMINYPDQEELEELFNQ